MVPIFFPYDRLYENFTKIQIYLEQGNQVLGALGYTDHSRKHTAKVAIAAGHILKKLGYDDHTIELARIVGLPHSNVEEGTSALIGAVQGLNEAMRIPARIRDLKVEEAAFRAALDSMAEHALDDMCTRSNPRRPSLTDIRALLEQAW